MQSDALGELAGEISEVVGGDPHPRALGMNVGEDPQQTVAV